MGIYFLKQFNMRHKQFNLHRYPKVYLKKLKERLEESANREASIHFRRKTIERQTNSNYNGEIDRIRGILHHSTLPGETKKRLLDRKEELKQLVASGLTTA
jgi:hypothetical protein